MRNPAEPAAARVRRGRALPDDACPTCGTMTVARRGSMRFPVNAEEVAVPAVAHLKCPACGEIVLAFAEVARLRVAAIEAYRKRHGLLPAEEIRRIRERFRLAQAELARLLRLGANTISRWESGRNVQTAAMDVLLRMILDLPGSIQWLRDHAA